MAAPPTLDRSLNTLTLSDDSPNNLDLSIHVFIDKLISNPLILDNIFAYCSPLTILRLSHTCLSSRLAVLSFLNRAYNINRHLSHYFTSPTSFRQLQCRTATIISGSNALQFLDRIFYPESDLDLYVSIEGIRELAAWIMSEEAASGEGYMFKPNSTQPRKFEDAVFRMEETAETVNALGRATGEYSMRGVLAVFTFLKDEGVEGKQRKIQLMTALASVPEMIINFHSTCVMNIITHDTAYSLYPRATFHSQISLVCPTDGHPLEDALEKYVGRGWSMIHVKPGTHAQLPSTTNPEALALAAKEPSFVPGTRWIDDQHSWVLPLYPPLDANSNNILQSRPSTSRTTSTRPIDPINADVPKMNPVNYMNWQLAYRKSELSTDDRQLPHMRYCLIRSKYLKEVYMLTDELLLLEIWGILRGVKSGQAEIRKVLEALEDGGGEGAGGRYRRPERIMHDQTLFAQCQIYRAAIKNRELPQTLWKHGPSQDPLFRM